MFDFLKKKKKNKIGTVDEKKTNRSRVIEKFNNCKTDSPEYERFWRKCFVLDEENGTFTIPFADLRENCHDKPFLENIAKNDKDLHRRTSAVYYLINFGLLFNSKGFFTHNEIMDKTGTALNLSETDKRAISDDFYVIMTLLRNFPNRRVIPLRMGVTLLFYK